MNLQSKVIVALGIFLLGLGGGYGVRGYMAGKQSLAHQVTEQQATLDANIAYLAKLADRDTQIQDLNQKLAKLDTDSTKELNEALSKNTDLSHDLHVAQRMRLAGTTCPARPAAGSEARTASSVGDGTEIELSWQTRQAVFDLRSGLVSDSAKLDYLQAYIRQVGLSPPTLP